MKPFKINTTARDLDTLQARVGALIAARLSEQAERTPHDVNERLRFAREQALLRAREARAAEAPAVVHSGAAAAWTLGGLGGHSPWRVRLAAVTPLLARAG